MTNTISFPNSGVYQFDDKFELERAYSVLMKKGFTAFRSQFKNNRK